MSVSYKRAWTLCLAWGVALAGLSAWPLSLAAADDERARLVQQRRVLNATFAAEEQACGQRFAVTACVDDLKLRRRQALAPLRERELQIDEAERVQKATARRATIAAKRAAAASAPLAASAASAAFASMPHLRVQRPPASPLAQPVPRARDDAKGRAAAADQRARQLQQSRDEAAATQQRIQQRLDAHKASGRKADSLPAPLLMPLPPPVPDAASAPRR